MNHKEYQKMVKELSTKNNKWKNYLIAALVGGTMSLLAELLVTILEVCCHLPNKEAVIWMMVIVVFLACTFTALGFFDKWVTTAKAGLIIPVTGFAHSIQSSVLDYKKDGLVTGMGANAFKLAGSVIVYGIIAAFFLVLIKVVFYG